MKLAAILAFLPAVAAACSTIQIICDPSRQELRPQFTVTVKYKQTPLPGVIVRVVRTEETDPGQPAEFSATTRADGTARFTVPPGRYEISGTKQDFYGAVECFHVSARPTRKCEGRDRTTVDGRATRALLQRHDVQLFLWE